jgi:hypothetical protein
MDISVIFLLAVFGGLIGAAIGNHKGRGVAGFFFGLFLGPLGWFIIAIGPDLRPKATAPAPAPTPAAQPAPTPAVPVADRLVELKRLLDAGAVTQAEYDGKKQVLLEKL